METLLPIVHGMVDGMATAKITITLPDLQLRRSGSVSQPRIPQASLVSFNRPSKNLLRMLPSSRDRGGSAEEDGGPLKPKERAWARKTLSARRRPTKPRKAAVNGVVFDAGGLIALERNDRRVFSILDTALEDGDRIIVPGHRPRQVIRNPARQVRLWRMIQFGKTEVIPLDGSQAQAVGALLARTSTSDITDAHVVICAQTAGYAIVTSDPLI